MNLHHLHRKDKEPHTWPAWVWLLFWVGIIGLFFAITMVVGWYQGVG